MKTNRRDFLKTAGAGLAGAAATQWTAWSQAGETRDNRSIPPHRPLRLTALHAYTTEQSVAAGQSISFHISSPVPYRLSICRLGVNVDDPAGDEVVHEFPEAHPTIQPIHPGSYIDVSKGLPRHAALKQLTLECWVRPWKPDAWAGLLGQFNFKSAGGYALLLNPDGGVSFYLGDGAKYRKEWMHTSSKASLSKGEWHHVIGTWDGREKALWIDGRSVGNWEFGGPVVVGTTALRLAACGDEDGQASRFLDGDLAMCAMYQRALAPSEIRARHGQRGLEPASGKSVLACWPFAEEGGSRVADRSRQRRHGLIVNHATWMIGGPSFKADVTRFGEYDPKRDANRGHGLRFASDDLYDCRWTATQRYQLPARARSGIYVGRIHYQLDGQPLVYHVTFVVRKPIRQKKAPILMLAATNTWRAYSGTPFAQNLPERKQVWGTNGSRNETGNPPAYCFYRGHAAGQGTYQLGMRIPWPVSGPYVLYGGPTDYSHLMRADRFAHTWLEKSGYQYDVISDLDLHRDPEQLNGYQVFFINGHSEYWSLPMYQGLEKYLRRGGNVVCLSGNTMFWRVSFNEDSTILECRKVDAPGEQIPAARRGECWHSQDGRRGGLLRECGFPGWRLVGLDTLGWNNQGVDKQFGPYLVETPDHFLFHRPEVVGVKKGDAIGQGPDGHLPRANGHEIDTRLSTLARLQEQPAPPGLGVPSDPRGMALLANGVITWKIGGAAFDYFLRPIKPKTDQGGELIYWERPEGGRVFNAGSIGAGWALAADEKFQTLLRNVLFHFGVKRVAA